MTLILIGKGLLLEGLMFTIEDIHRFQVCKGLKSYPWSFFHRDYENSIPFTGIPNQINLIGWDKWDFFC